MQSLHPGPAERVVHWRHVSTVFLKFHAISKNVRQRSVGETVQKLEPIIILALCFDPRDVLVHLRVRIQRFWWLMEVLGIAFYVTIVKGDQP